MTPIEIKALRKAANLTQHELARQLKTTSNTVARWESGLHEPDRLMIREIKRICKKAEIT